MLQNATPLRKSAPWLPNITHEHVFCTAPATRNSSWQILFKCPTPAMVFGNATKPSRFAHFWQGAQSLAPATRNDIWTSKSGASMWCFVHFDFEMCFAPQRRALFRHLNFQKWSDTGVLCTFWLRNVLRATTACTFLTSQLPKVIRHWCALYILTSKCASRHNGVHFFDISTSKSDPTLVCFVHFDFEMCFAPQACTFSTSQLPKVIRHWCVLYILTSKCASRHKRALFWHLNFQKWSGPGVFCTFWLRNVLRATTVCTFSSLIWPDGSAPAALASLLFDPPEPQSIGKTQCFAAFLPFRASASSFFWLFLFYHLLSSALLFSLPLPSSAFHLSILSEVWLLVVYIYIYIHSYI